MQCRRTVLMLGTEIIYRAELTYSMYRGKSNTCEQERARRFSHVSQVWLMGHKIRHTK